MTSRESLDNCWGRIENQVLNRIKISLLDAYGGEIIQLLGSKIDEIVYRYTRFLPKYVAENEREDLRTVAQLELIETIKSWDPRKSETLWPLAHARIIGAMKDHIRYVTRSDPSRLYDWMTEAAYIFLAVNQRADFEHRIETGLQLSQAMKGLSYREKKIIILHTKNDQTFKQIGQRLGISESQISRIYKAAVEKIKKTIHKKRGSAD